MTTALLVIGYVAVGLIFGRIGYHVSRRFEQGGEETAQFLALTCFFVWPCALLVGSFGAIAAGVLWVTARPPKRERIQAKIVRLERELDIR